jgi:hypothetical protein
MKVKQTMGNHIMVKLDQENNVVKTKTGFTLYIDTTFEPEKHTVVTGTVIAIPKNLYAKELPWVTENELQVGDKVAMYYMAVMNCLSNERKKFIKEFRETFIFIAYSNIYAAVRKEQIIPINGYILAEPIPDPYFEKKKEEYLAKGIELVELETKKNKDVCFAKAVHVGKPNTSYKDPNQSDDHINVQPGDDLILKRLRDIPIEYEYHAKLDGGRKLYRIQRHDILAVL